MYLTPGSNEWLERHRLHVHSKHMEEGQEAGARPGSCAWMRRCCCAASCGYQGAPTSHQVQLQVGASNARHKEDDCMVGMGAAHLSVLGVGRLSQVFHDQRHGQHQLGLGGHARGHWRLLQQCSHLMAQHDRRLGPGSRNLSLHVGWDGQDGVGQLSAHRANIFTLVNSQSLAVGSRTLPLKAFHVALVTSQVNVVATRLDKHATLIEQIKMGVEKIILKLDI